MNLGCLWSPWQPKATTIMDVVKKPMDVLRPGCRDDIRPCLPCPAGFEKWRGKGYPSRNHCSVEHLSEEVDESWGEGMTSWGGWWGEWWWGGRQLYWESRPLILLKQTKLQLGLPSFRDITVTPHRTVCLFPLEAIFVQSIVKGSNLKKRSPLYRHSLHRSQQYLHSHPADLRQ